MRLSSDRNTQKQATASVWALLVSTVLLILGFSGYLLYEPLRAKLIQAQVRAAVDGPYTGSNFKDYYVVTATNAAEDTGDEVCAALGMTCIGYTLLDTSVCTQVHPSATVDNTSVDGSRAGYYCDGAPQTGPACEFSANSCKVCPTCTVGISCSEPIGALYREMYVECADVSGAGSGYDSGLVPGGAPTSQLTARTITDVFDNRNVVIRDEVTETNNVIAMETLNIMEPGASHFVSDGTNYFIFYTTGSDPTPTTSYDRYVDKLDADGDTIWSALIDVSGGYHSINEPLDLVVDGVGGAYAVRLEGDDLGGGTYPTVTHINGSGVTDQFITYPTDSFFGDGAFAVRGGGGAFLLLIEEDDDSDLNLHAFSGATVDASFGTAGTTSVSTNQTSAKSAIEVLPDGSGGVYVLWIDNAPNEQGVYAQHITSTGAIAVGWDTRGEFVTPGQGPIQADLVGTSLYISYTHVSNGDIQVINYDVTSRANAWQCAQDIPLWTTYDVVGNSDGVFLVFDDTVSGLQTQFAQHFDGATGDSTWQLGGEVIDELGLAGIQQFYIGVGGQTVSSRGLDEDGSDGFKLSYAYGNSNRSPHFEQINTATYAAGPGGDCLPTAPEAPTNLAGTPADSQITLTWTPSVSDSAPVDDYIVEYGESSGWPGNAVAFVDGVSGTPGAVVTGLTNDTEYSFRVYAENGFGTSSASSTATATPSLFWDLDTTNPLLSDAFENAAAVAFDNKIYLFGGYDPNLSSTSDKVFIYDPSLPDGSRWSEDTTDPMPGPRQQGCVLNGDETYIYYFMGYDGTEPTDDVFIYDPFASDGNRWTTGTPAGFANGRMALGCAFDNAGFGLNAYLIGGMNPSFSFTDTVIMYDTFGDSWTTGLSSKPTPPFSFITAQNPVFDDRLIFVAMDGDTTFEVYDIDGDSWFSVESLPDSPDGPCSFTYDGNMYVTGLGATQQEVWRFEPAVDDWFSIPKLNFFRYVCAAAVVNEEFYVLAGSSRNDFETLAAVATPEAPTLILPADGATTNVYPFLSVLYRSGGNPGETHYRVSSSSLSDCTNNVNIIASATSQTTATKNEATGVIFDSGIFENETYYWCAQNEDNGDLSDWTEMGSFSTTLDTPYPNYSTYVGGTGFDAPIGIAIDAAGVVYVTGYTDSTDFPVSAGVFDQTPNAGQDVVVSAIDLVGAGSSDLVFSTYLGGTGDEIGIDIDVDGSFVYVTGSTSSTNFPTAGGAGGTAYDSTNGSGFLIAFVSVFDLDGTSLHYSTYVGTGDNVQPASMDLYSGDVYVVGNVFGSSLPTTAGAFDTTLNTFQDGFFFKLSPDGDGSSDLEYSTYVGGNSNDESIESIDVDSGVAYLGMYTSATNLTTTAGAFDMTHNSSRDGYIARLNPAGGGGTDLTYGSYFGGSGSNDVIRGIHFNSGNIYVTGFTNSANFPVVSGSYSTTHPGGDEGFMSVLTPNGLSSSDLVYGTFLGGTAGYTVIRDADLLYVLGRTLGGFSTTSNAFDTNFTSTQFGLTLQQFEPLGNDSADLLYATIIESNDDQTYTQPASNGMVFDPSTLSAIFAAEVGSHSYPTLALGGTPYDHTFNESSDFIITRFTFEPVDPHVFPPTLRFPDDGAARAGQVYLSALYRHGGLTGTTEYRVSSSSTTDCVNNVNVIDTQSSATTATNEEPTIVQIDPLSNGTYYWCARNNDGVDQSAWTAMGSFVKDNTVPYMNYLSYLGGAGVDTIAEIDLVGSTIYFVGNTDSTDLPTTSGVIEESALGGGDVFLGAFETNGSGSNDLLFLTYIGSTGAETVSDVRHAGSSLYLSGATGSSTFPATSGAYDEVYNGGNDGYAMRLDENATTIEYSTYFGGTSNDSLFLGDVEGGVMYFGASSGNGTFPTTAGAYDTSYNGGLSDSAIVILDPQGGGSADLIYSTFIGGSSNDGHLDVAYVSGLVYFAGDPFSSNFPTTGGSYDTSNNGAADLVFGRLNPAGGGSSDLQYSSFVGGSSNEFLNGLFVDQTTGEMFAVGVATSGFPTTAGAFDTSFTDSELFITKFDTGVAGAGALEYSTYMGGFGIEFASDVVYDGTDIFVVGASLSENSVVTTATAYGNSYIDDGFSTEDAYLVRLTPAGTGSSDLLYASYFGVDSISERFTALAVDGEIVYAVGTLDPYTFESFADPGTPFDSTPNDFDQDGFIMRIDFDGAASSNSAPSAPTSLFSNNSNAQLGSSNPTGITSSTPVFSAICNDSDSGDILDMYRIQVDDNNDFSSTVWDSGALGTAMANCVAGARSANITFGGAPLAQDGTTYYWRIKFWDDEPSEGAFSQTISTNTFTMAASGGGGGGGGNNQAQQQQATTLGIPAIGPVTVLGTDSVRFDFTYSGSNQTGFRLLNEQNQAVVQVANSAATSLTQTGFPHNTLVTGRKVVAYNNSTQGLASATYPDTYTHIVSVTPSLVSRVDDRIRVRINEALNNLIVGQSGVQFELMLESDLSASAVQQSPWTQTNDYVFEGTVPGQTYYVRSRSRNANGSETAWSSTLLVEGEELIEDVELLVGLAVMTANGTQVDPDLPLNPNELLYGEITLVNNGSTMADNVFLALPLPQYLTYLPGSLSVDGIRQTDAADLDAGQAGNDIVAAIWPTLDFAFGHTVRFALAFDTPRLIEDFIKPVETDLESIRQELGNELEVITTPNEVKTEVDVNQIPKEPLTAPEVDRGDFIDPNLDRPSFNQSTESLRDVLAQAIAATGPQLTMQASASHAGDPQPSYSNPVTAQPDLVVLADISAPAPAPEPTPEPAPVPLPTPEDNQTIEQVLQEEFGTPQPGAPILETGETSSSFDGESFGLSTDNGLAITGTASTVEDQIQFTGTTSQPFTVVTLILNDSVTLIVVSDANGEWRTFVDAETLGIQPGQQADVHIEAIAAKGDIRSERVTVGDVTLVRGRDGEVVAEFDTIVSENSFITAVNEISRQTIEVIQEQEPAIQTTLTAAAPVIVVSSVPLWGYLPYIPTLIYHFIAWLLGLFGRKKKEEEKTTYGVIYDAITKLPLPLAIVRIYEQTANRLVTTVVTDKLGRYDVLLAPGTYRLEVSKPQYQFPSQIVTTTIDGKYDRVYQATTGMNVQENVLVIPQVPVDPVNVERDWEMAFGFRKAWLALQRVGHYLATPILMVGTLSGILLVVADPSKAFNWVIVGMYALLLLSQLRLKPKAIKAWGVVYDIATNSALPLTTIQLIEPAYNKVVTSRLTDYQGRFSFLPEPGQYLVKANKPGYEQVKEVVESKYTDRKPMSEQVNVDKPDQRIAGDVAMRSLG